MQKYSINANLGQSYKCSLDDLGHRRMALNSWSKDKGVFCHPPSSTVSSNASCIGALEEQYGKANIDGRTITNLRFADGIDALAEEELEQKAQATQLMTNSANDMQREIKVKEQKQGTVTSFKYNRAVVLDGGFKPEVFSRIAQST